jgi:hypothetical protein
MGHEQQASGKEGKRHDDSSRCRLGFRPVVQCEYSYSIMSLGEEQHSPLPPDRITLQDAPDNAIFEPGETVLSRSLDEGEYNIHF